MEGLGGSDRDRIKGILDGAVRKGTKRSYTRNITQGTRALSDPLVVSDTTWERKDKVGLVVLYMDYLRSHATQPNINNCMVALSDHLRMNMTEESIVHNWVVQGAKKSLTRKTGRDLSLAKEKRFRLPTPFVFIRHILTTYMSNQLDWDNCDSYIMMTGLDNMVPE